MCGTGHQSKNHQSSHIWRRKESGSAQGYIWSCGQLHRTWSVTIVSTTSGGNEVKYIPTTHERVAMTTSTHCGCGVFGGCGGSCSVSGRALLCACPPSTLQGKRNTSTHSSWTHPPLEVTASNTCHLTSIKIHMHTTQ